MLIPPSSRYSPPLSDALSSSRRIFLRWEEEEPPDLEPFLRPLLPNGSKKEYGLLSRFFALPFLIAGAGAPFPVLSSSSSNAL